jgi:[acyl-carrier-protein] S-malonyltransferase
MRPLAMCPGQGSQRPGMAAELLDRYPTVAGPVFALAEDVLALPLRRLCVNGTAEELRRTDVTQPAVVTTSLAVLAVLADRGFVPAAVAGHSLGEYTALCAAGVLTAESALRLVRRRGELMAEVGDRVPGAMLAVIGLPAETVERLCVDVDGAEVANYNDPAQTVVSGLRESVALIDRAAMAAGAERAVTLHVGAPFHCSLMAGIEAEFAAELNRHEFAEPRLPVLSAVTADYVKSAEQSRKLLRRQLTGPVRWVDTVRLASVSDIDAVVETGPGRVLAGFAKRTVPELPVYGTGNVRAIESLLARQPHLMRKG